MKPAAEWATWAAHNSETCLDEHEDGEEVCDLCIQCADVISEAHADARAGMVPEAELAKAWCDGRDAAAAECGDSNAAPLARIRALQPPGGKAK